MAKVTDLEAIKEEAISLLYEPLTGYGHPILYEDFTQTLPDGTEREFDIYGDPDDLEEVIMIETDAIENATTAIQVLSHISSSYQSEFLKTIEQYISEEDVAEIKSVFTWLR